LEEEDITDVDGKQEKKELEREKEKENR